MAAAPTAANGPGRAAPAGAPNGAANGRGWPGANASRLRRRQPLHAKTARRLPQQRPSEKTRRCIAQWASFRSIASAIAAAGEKWPDIAIRCRGHGFSAASAACGARQRRRRQLAPSTPPREAAAMPCRRLSPPAAAAGGDAAQWPEPPAAKGHGDLSRCRHASSAMPPPPPKPAADANFTDATADSWRKLRRQPPGSPPPNQPASAAPSSCALDNGPRREDGRRRRSCHCRRATHLRSVPHCRRTSRPALRDLPASPVRARRNGEGVGAEKRKAGDRQQSRHLPGSRLANDCSARLCGRSCGGSRDRG